MMQTLMNNYARLPIAFVRGEGAWLWDGDGNRYLDAIGGLGVCVLGHAHPEVTAAVCDQAGKLIHTSNLFGIGLQQQLADRLTALTGMDNAFFCNSGTEANEAAIKMARLYGHQKDIEAPALLVTENSFHGRTLAALSATGNKKMQAGFEPLVQGFVRVAYNDVQAMRAALASHDGIVGVMLEPVQGEGGVNVPDQGYLAAVRELCDEHGLLMIADEVQTGMGRTGSFLACQLQGVTPDIVTMAKGLANGLPIGACLARGPAAGLLTPGSHGTTFGGNPLACRAALAVLDVIEQQALTRRAAELGRTMLDGFRDRLGGVAHVVSVRGHGLMIGIEQDRPCQDLALRALDEGLVINVAATRVIRLLPPLILGDEQAAQVIETVCGLVRLFR